jgi:hypothetical protein
VEEVEMSWKRLSLVPLVVLASGLIAAGCGGDDDDGGDGGDGVNVPTDISVPTIDEESVEEAQQQATEAVEDAQSQAYERCLDSLDQVPEAQRDQVEQACESLKP